MNHNKSEIPLNSTSDSVLVKWRCPGFEFEEILSPDYLFIGNVYVFTLVNTFSAVFGLLSNSLIIFGACKYRMIRILGAKLSKALTIFLAIQGMFSAVIIQPFFVTSRFLMLANINNPLTIMYCLLVLIVDYGTKLLTGLATLTVLGMNLERYIAVVHPHQYKAYQKSLLKLLIFLLVIIPTHFAFYSLWAWYKKNSKPLSALYTFVPYVFTVYVYVKIYLKLRHLDRVRISNNTNAGTPTHRNSTKKTQSLMSFLVVGSYLLCYLPMLMIRLLKLDEASLLVKMYLRPWSTTLLLSSFSVNALVYGWRSAKISFQKAVGTMRRSEPPCNDSTV